MSYCRWSSNDFQCDLYIYESYDSIVIHVAGNKVIFKEPLPEWVDLTPGNADKWFRRHQIVMEMIDRAERVPLNLPHDGETFNFPTHIMGGKVPALGVGYEAAAKVRELIALGYRCPESVIKELEAWEPDDAGS